MVLTRSHVHVRACTYGHLWRIAHTFLFESLCVCCACCSINFPPLLRDLMPQGLLPVFPAREQPATGPGTASTGRCSWHPGFICFTTLWVSTMDRTKLKAVPLAMRTHRPQAGQTLPRMDEVFSVSSAFVYMYHMFYGHDHTHFLVSIAVTRR